MIIYQESKAKYLEDVDNNLLKNRLVEAFLAKTGSIPSDQYVWADEYRAFAQALQKTSAEEEIEVAIEYHISAAGRYRIDILLAGNDGVTDNGLIIELKAWEKADLSDVPEMVFAPVAGGSIKQHPCVQARKYKGLILRFNQDVREQKIQIHSSAYLFNLRRRNPEPLEDIRYQQVLTDSKLFLADDVSQLRQYIDKIVPKRPKKNVVFFIENGRLRPTDELVGRVSSMLDGNEEFELIDEQNEAFQTIRYEIFKSRTLESAKRHVFVVEGGPGTGKSVIAIRLLAEILKAKRMGFFIAPNKAFRDTLVEFLARGNTGYREDGQALLKSPWSFHDVDFEKNGQNEVLIVDEAHRLKDEAYQYMGESMIEDMVRAARMSIFFIDEAQRVAWNDAGSVSRIKSAAAKFGAKFHEPFKLTAQFRCNGSVGYINWLDDTLQIRETGNFDNWGDDQYEFKIFDDAAELYAALKAKNHKNKARLVAGYSWEWPTQGRSRGTIAKHVQAGNLSLPWNYDGENWATSQDGIEQVGCVHTSQGVEFDWLGVLIGEDLAFQNGEVFGDSNRRAKTDASLKGSKKAFKEAGGDIEKQKIVRDKVQLIIKSTYKVLLSRGRKGCFVWCADAGLREYLKSRLALACSENPENVVSPLPALIQNPGTEKFINYIPVYSLAAAAGSFGKPDPADCIGWIKAPVGIKVTDRHFVAKVVGRSMEPLIKDESYCLFRFGVEGSRMGRILLVQLSNATDPESGGSYTVKKYQSQKAANPEHDWEHARIQLMPINLQFKPIEITADDAENIRVVAEFVAAIL